MLFRQAAAIRQMPEASTARRLPRFLPVCVNVAVKYLLILVGLAAYKLQLAKAYVLHVGIFNVQTVVAVFLLVVYGIEIYRKITSEALTESLVLIFS